MEILSKKCESTWSLLFKNNTMHIATVPTGIEGYIESFITSVKPSSCKNFDLNTLIQSVVHCYHLETTEPIKVHYQDIKPSEVIRIDLYELHSVTILYVMYNRLKI